MERELFFMKSMLFIVVIICPLIMQSCLRTMSDTSMREDIPPGFNLVFGEGGGITGRWQGFAVDASGTVLRWEGRVAGEDGRALGSLSREELISLWKRSLDLGRLAEGASQKGDLTYYVLLTLGGSKKEFEWTDDGSSRSKILHDFYSHCHSVIEEKTLK